MADDSTVKVKFIGDAKDLEKAIDGLDKDLSRVSKSAEKAGGGFGAFAKKAGVGLGAVGVGAAALGVSMFELGNKLDIMKKKAATVFEESLPLVQKWASESATAMGLTKNQATGLAAGFGDLLKPMGFTAQQAAEMSTKVLGLSGALSAWSGGTRTAEEVTNSLSKAMLGEREELKGLGISITEADVSQRLLKNGTDELTGAAREQAKAIATMELIFEKSTDAQKAFNEGQFDGQTTANGLKVKMQDLKESIAEKLYPALLNLGDWMLRVGIPRIEEIAGKAADWWAKQDGLRDAIQKGAEQLKAFTEDLITFIGWVKEAVEWTDALAKKITSLPGGDVSGMDILGNIPGGDKGLIDIIRGKAAGGPVAAGMPYVVGERGPELFVPGRSGSIIPNGGGGNGRGGGQTFIVEMGGREIVRLLVDEGDKSGGLPIRIRAAS